MQAPPNAAPDPNAVNAPPVQDPNANAAPGQNQGMPNIIGPRGIFYPRWAVLAAMLMTIGSVAGYLILLSYQSRPCTVAFFCGIDTWPGVAQIITIWLIYLVLCFLILLVGAGSLETKNPHRQPVAEAIIKFLNDLSNFNANNFLYFAFGGIGIIGTVAMIRFGHFQAVAFAYCGILIYIAVLILRYDPRPPRQLTAQERLQVNNARAGNPLSVLGTLPGFNRLAPFRVRRQDRNPPPPPAGGGAYNPPPQGQGGAAPNTGTYRGWGTTETPIDPNDPYII